MTGDPQPDSRPMALLVDDEASVLTVMERVLSPHYRVVTAGTVQGAAEALKGRPVRVILCDHFLPDGLGLDFLQELHRRRAAPVRILITGHSHEELAIAALNGGGIFRYLAKPFAPAQLLQTVQDAVRQYDRENDAREADGRLDRPETGSPPPRLARMLHFVGLILLGAAVLALGLLALGTLTFLILYWLKSALGIDLFKDSHLSDWL